MKFLEYDSTGLQKDENCEMLNVENSEIQSSILDNQVSDLPADELCLELGKLQSNIKSIEHEPHCTHVHAWVDLKGQTLRSRSTC